MIRKHSISIAILLISAFIYASSCTSSKNAGSTTANRSDIKGTWVLDDVNYDGVPQGQNVKMTLLGEGDATCLKGSTWILPNNGNGSYTIQQNESTNCTPGERSIVWSYRENNGQPVFQYKRLPGGVKAKDVTDGYRFDIISATETSMVLRSNVPYEGNTINITYTFSKR